ncbi:MAG: glycogen/starch synthase [Pirellulales bacterium]|nr:glycogen/starch synthase [Pirellulales bacterium]
MENAQQDNRLRVALAAWEIGRVSSGLGAKAGGLGVIVEELPPALVNAGRNLGLDVELVTLGPCFGTYDRSRLNKLPQTYPAVIDNRTHQFEAYEHTFENGQRVVYFWNQHWLGPWGPPSHVYPPEVVALRTYAAVCQAMAGFLSEQPCDTFHLHDYHVGLIPFYLSAEKADTLPFHLTIHNASYQGVYTAGNAAELLAAIHLDGPLFERYFQFFDNVNLMRAAMVRTHETGGKVTTVSGDLEASWGYARELREPRAELIQRARRTHPRLYYLADDEVAGRIYFPAQGLAEFQEIPVAGITNGISDENKAQHLPWLKAETLRAAEVRFSHPEVQHEMTSADHGFSPDDLTNKQKLKRLLHLEAFGTEPEPNTVLLVVVGRMVEQKGLHLVAGIMDRIRRGYPEAKFVVLGSAPRGDLAGHRAVQTFAAAAGHDPEGVFFRNGFDLALSKLMLAGGDFSFIPSRFEPCGIVDYESVLLGTIVIGRLTGGLAKVSDFSFLYEWFEPADEQGEMDALFTKTAEAISAFRDQPDRILDMRRRGMAIDGSWRRSATQYLQMYQYGQVMQRCKAALRQRAAEFLQQCPAEEVNCLRQLLDAGSGRQHSALSADLRCLLDAFGPA